MASVGDAESERLGPQALAAMRVTACFASLRGRIGRETGNQVHDRIGIEHCRMLKRGRLGLQRAKPGAQHPGQPAAGEQERAATSKEGQGTQQQHRKMVRKAPIGNLGAATVSNLSRY